VTGDTGMAADHLRYQTNRSSLAAQTLAGHGAAALIAAAADRRNDRPLDGVRPAAGSR
jgi:hypothetical protein